MRNCMVVMVLLLLGACGAGEGEPEPESEDKKHRHGYEESLDRARAVEEELQKAAERQREALEEQGG